MLQYLCVHEHISKVLQYRFIRLHNIQSRKKLVKLVFVIRVKPVLDWGNLCRSGTSAAKIYLCMNLVMWMCFPLFWRMS